MILEKGVYRAPDSLIDSDGRPLIGQFDGIPKQLGVDKFDYRTNMDRQASKLSKHFHYKQFQFVSLFVGRYVIGVAIADIRYLGSSFCYVYDVDNDELLEQNWLRPLGFDKSMTCSPFQGSTCIAGKQVQFHIYDGIWQLEIRTSQINANLYLQPNEDSQPIAMCTPTGYSGWTYTQKHNALKVEGVLSIQGQPIDISEALAGYDFSAGYMRRETSWRWASISSNVSGCTLGLNLAAGVNETGSSENVIWVDGQRHLLGPVHFQFQRCERLEQWKIFSESGQVDLQFQPINQRSEKLNFWWLKSNFRQFIGHFSGTIIDNSGVSHTLDRVLGLTEDHFTRW
ncbi:DUF2804 domain-containing protein [Vibrio sinaloensis]|uniref:DUF2804 domain-containing protein n=1 Tax=Photobacterium sp. (strain ATCC 43367) TaxID=379097 RepID=UPI0035EB0BC7